MRSVEMSKGPAATTSRDGLTIRIENEIGGAYTVS